jgi:hypothetical protein
MIALRVAELRKEAVATRAAASIEMELENQHLAFCDAKHPSRRGEGVAGIRVAIRR